jgi:hypothetical protein
MDAMADAWATSLASQVLDLMSDQEEKREENL